VTNKTCTRTRQSEWQCDEPSKLRKSSIQEVYACLIQVFVSAVREVRTIGTAVTI